VPLIPHNGSPATLDAHAPAQSPLARRDPDAARLARTGVWSFTSVAGAASTGDATVALQSAFERGGHVYLPAGEYVVRVGSAASAYTCAPWAFALSSFRNEGGARLIFGDGRGETIIRLVRVERDAAEYAPRLCVLALRDCELRDLTIDAGWTIPAGEPDEENPQASTYAPTVMANGDSVVENCEIINSEGTALLGTGRAMIFRGNRIADYGGWAIHAITKQPAAVVIEDNECPEGDIVIHKDVPLYGFGRGWCEPWNTRRL
jgi:hypothetical protein